MDVPQEETLCIGSMLRQKREEMLLSLEDVASRLCLRKRLLEDLEQGNYQSIPATYLKGYLRSYAKLLALSDLVSFNDTDFNRKDDVMGGWQVFSTKKQVSASDKFFQWITFAIIAVLILLVTLWWKSDHLLYKNLSFAEAPDHIIYQLAENHTGIKN